jgi:hypothetical protein
LWILKRKNGSTIVFYFLFICYHHCCCCLLLLLLLIVLDLVESGLGVKQPFSPFVFFLVPLGDRDRPYMVRDKRVVDERR